MAPALHQTQFPSEEQFDTLIDITVGQDDETQTFQVFKGVLCFYSGYFETCLNSEFREARESAVRLPTEDPRIFELFVHWIHKRVFFDSTLHPAILLDTLTLCKLWIFGDAQHVPMLQNEAIRLLVARFEMIGEMRTFEEAFKTVSEMQGSMLPGSALGRLLCRVVFRNTSHLGSAVYISLVHGQIDWDDRYLKEFFEREARPVAILVPTDYFVTG